ncbi:MAG: heparan-alpha-glucosaminide N-acetyltransferase domain-containing protein, partial [Gemmataceae bacterium]
MGIASDEQHTPAIGTAPVRVIGYDIARTLALLGMIVVHFSLVAAADRSNPAWLASVLAYLDGRAAATFVVLAGIGLTLMSRRAVASGDPAARAKLRSTFVRRGLFLLVIGFLNLTFWPGDILRVYGVSLIMASCLFMAPSRRILALAAVSALVFAVLVLVGDFEKNWDWRTLTYRNLWTPTGVVRNLFYDGFRSVLPWTGFILFGMW